MTLEQALVESNKKLQQFKNLPGRKMIVCDWDETLVSPSKAPDLTAKKVIQFCNDFIKNGYTFLVASARGVTIERIVSEYLTNNSIYIAGADGRFLSLFVNGKKDKVFYEYAIPDDKLQEALEIYKNVRNQRSLKKRNSVSVNAFKMLLEKKWEESLLPSRFIQKAQKFNGEIFIEPTKFSIAGPERASDFAEVVSILNEHLEKIRLQASWGGKDGFIHIRPHFDVDGKMKALKTVMQIEQIKQNNVITFGDAPNGNDRGILFNMEYGFTNDVNVLKNHEAGVPPYILFHIQSQVHAVHSAIQSLL